MGIPELPVDIIHLICSLLKDDHGSIYSLALCNRLYSSVALPALYYNPSKVPVDYDRTRSYDRRIGRRPITLITHVLIRARLENPTDHDNEDRLIVYKTSLRKCSSLWKSLLHSALKPRKTTINYAAALRILDLRSLSILMQEFFPDVDPDSTRQIRQAAKKQFFEGGLEEYNKTSPSVGEMTSGTYNWIIVADCLTDLIVKETKNVTVLEGRMVYDHLPGHLHLWLQNTPSLEALRLYSGSTLSDERVVEALNGCPNLRSLEFGQWGFPADREDADAVLARLLRSMVIGLRRLVIRDSQSSGGGDSQGCFGELALSALSHYHGNTLRELEVFNLRRKCFFSLHLASNIINLRSCCLYVETKHNSWRDPEEKFAAVSEFFSRNTSLETLNVGIVGTSTILSKALPNLHLKHLIISNFADYNSDTPFLPVISSQANSLETLILRNHSYAEHPRRVTEERLKVICLLHKLRVLTIAGFVSLLDEQIGRIADNCPDVEEFSVASSALSDCTLQHLSKLKRLRIFNSTTPNEITLKGLKELVTALPSLRAMNIYAHEGQAAFEKMSGLREALDARGGQGLTLR